MGDQGHQQTAQAPDGGDKGGNDGDQQQGEQNEQDQSIGRDAEQVLRAGLSKISRDMTEHPDTNKTVGARAAGDKQCLPAQVFQIHDFTEDAVTAALMKGERQSSNAEEQGRQHEK